MRFFLLVGLMACGEPVSPEPPELPSVELPKSDPPIEVTYADLCETTPPVGFNSMVEEAAHAYSIDPWVLAVTVYRESDCRVKAEGASGEIGLCQINPSVWVPTLVEAGLIKSEEDLWDPATNMRAGAYIMAEMRRRSSTEWEMFRRYNGSGARARQYAAEQVAALDLVRSP